MKTLNYKRMVKDALPLVETDFAFDMECKLLPKAKKYTQTEAERMADIISKIYSILHCQHCSACQTKYLISRESKTGKAKK